MAADTRASATSDGSDHDSERTYTYDPAEHSAPPSRIEWCPRSGGYATRFVFVRCCGAIGQPDRFDVIRSPLALACPIGARGGEGDVSGATRCGAPRHFHKGGIVVLRLTLSRMKGFVPTAVWSCCRSVAVPTWSAAWDARPRHKLDVASSCCDTDADPSVGDDAGGDEVGELTLKTLRLGSLGLQTARALPRVSVLGGTRKVATATAEELSARRFASSLERLLAARLGALSTHTPSTHGSAASREPAELAGAITSLVEEQVKERLALALSRPVRRSRKQVEQTEAWVGDAALDLYLALEGAAFGLTVQQLDDLRQHQFSADALGAGAGRTAAEAVEADVGRRILVAMRKHSGVGDVSPGGDEETGGESDPPDATGTVPAAFARHAVPVVAAAVDAVRIAATAAGGAARVAAGGAGGAGGTAEGRSLGQRVRDAVRAPFWAMTRRLHHTE